MGQTVHPIKTNFTAGELSPKALARIDFERYYDGAETIENFIPMPLGGIVARPGTRMVHETKNSSDKSNLFAFEYNEEQSYCLEFGDQYIRFFTDDGILLEAEKAITAITQANPGVVTISSHGYSNGDHLILKNILGMTELNGKTVIVANSTTHTFELTDVDGNNIDTSAFTVYGSEGTAERIYEISSPYAIADVPDIQLAQSADVMYIVHRSYAPRKLERTGATNWSLTSPTFSGTVGGGFNAAGEYPGAVAFFEERLAFASSNDQPQTLFFSQSGDFENFDPGTSLADEAIEITISSDKRNGIRWLSPGSKLAAGTEGAEFLVGSNSQDDAMTPTNVKASRQDTMGSSQDRPIRVGKSDLFIQRAKRKIGDFSYNFEEDSNISRDITEISDLITRSGVVEMDYQKEPNKTIYMPLENGYLATLTYQKRQNVQGWAKSILGGNFQGGNAVVESVVVIPDSNQDQVWLQVKRTINGVTRRYIEYMTEFFVADDDTGIEDAIQVDASLTRDGDAANLAGVNGGFETFYNGIPSGWTKVGDTSEQETGAANINKGSSSVKLTRTSSATYLYIQNAGFAAYQGKTITFKCYVKTDTAGRARIGILDGVGSTYSSYHTGSGSFEVLTVTRQLDASATKMEFRLDIDNGPAEVYFDSAMAVPGASGEELYVNTVSGYDHLEGETVSVLADGKVQPQQAITNGALTIAQGTYKKITIGLPYTPKFVTLPFEQGNPAGTSQGKKSNITHVVFRLFQTVGGHAGHKNETDLLPIQYEDEIIMDQASGLVTDDVRHPIDGEISRRAQIVFEQRDPVPTTVLAVMPEYSVNP